MLQVAVAARTSFHQNFSTKVSKHWLDFNTQYIFLYMLQSCWLGCAVRARV